ncbi:MAG: endolytic transglycosylase MltG [Rikenellaceae bacterium]
MFLYNQFYGSAVDEDISIYVIDRSVEDEVLPYVENHWGFNFYAKRLDLQRRLKVGFYSLRRGDSVVDVVRQLSLGEQTEVRLTFNNIRNFSDLAARISTQIAADSTSLYSAFTQWEGGDTTRLFSKFIPNTYSLYWSITPESLIERMTRESDKFWSGGRDEKRNSLGFSREKIMTLASIVYEETKHIDEMPRVAGVYLNRLKRGMPLQADPTVKYAIGDFSIKRILYKHLEYDSPYNTYKYKGLPPSPISMPSIAAIDAVLSAESHNYLYFCARASFDGYHNFAKSYGEHLRYAREYSAALNKLKL